MSRLPFVISGGSDGAVCLWSLFQPEALAEAAEVAAASAAAAAAAARRAEKKEKKRGKRKGKMGKMGKKGRKKKGEEGEEEEDKEDSASSSPAEIPCKSALTLPLRERLRVRLLLRDGHKPNMVCSTMSGGAGTAIAVAETSNDLTVFTGLDRV